MNRSRGYKPCWLLLKKTILQVYKQKLLRRRKLLPASGASSGRTVIYIDVFDLITFDTGSKGDVRERLYELTQQTLHVPLEKVCR